MNSNEVKQTEQDVQILREKIPNLVIYPPLCRIYALGKWVSMDSGDGFSPVRCQSITRTSADLQSIGPLGTNFSEIVIEIQALSLKIHLKMSSAIFISLMEFYIHTWHVYGVEMYKLVNSE